MVVFETVNFMGRELSCLSQPDFYGVLFFAIIGFISFIYLLYKLLERNRNKKEEELSAQEIINLIIEDANEE